MDMAMWLKRSALIGLGIVSLTKKKADKLAKDLAKRGAIGEKEAKNFAKQLMQESKKQSVKIEKLVQKEVTKTLRTLGIASRADIEKLRRELNKKKRR